MGTILCLLHGRVRATTTHNKSSSPPPHCCTGTSKCYRVLVLHFECRPTNGQAHFESCADTRHGSNSHCHARTASPGRSCLGDSTDDPCRTRSTADSGERTVEFPRQKNMYCYFFISLSLTTSLYPARCLNGSKSDFLWILFPKLERRRKIQVR